MTQDRGFVTVWTVAITATLFVIIAFTLDAGRVVRANSDAYGTAAAAARVAVNQLDQREHVISGAVQLIEADAVAAAKTYCQARGYTCDVVVDGATLTAQVTAHDVVNLHMPVPDQVSIDVEANAQAVQVPG